MSAPLLVSQALQTAAADQMLPDVIYTLWTRGNDPIIGALYENGVWAHEHHDFHGETFPPTRCGQLNVMPVTWTWRLSSTLAR